MRLFGKGSFVLDVRLNDNLLDFEVQSIIGEVGQICGVREIRRVIDLDWTEEDTKWLREAAYQPDIISELKRLRRLSRNEGATVEIQRQEDDRVILRLVRPSPS